MARAAAAEDLRSDGRTGQRFVLSLNLAVTVSIILAAMGVFAAVVLPELFSQGVTAPETGSSELPVLLSLTMDEVKLGDWNLSNAPLPDVLFLLLDGDGQPTGLDAQVREFISRALVTILGEGKAFKLKVYSGGSGDLAWEVLSPIGPPDGRDPAVQRCELRPPPKNSATGLISLTLEVWTEV